MKKNIITLLITAAFASSSLTAQAANTGKYDKYTPNYQIKPDHGAAGAAGSGVWDINGNGQTNSAWATFAPGEKDESGRAHSTDDIAKEAWVRTDKNYESIIYLDKNKVDKKEGAEYVQNEIEKAKEESLGDIQGAIDNSIQASINAGKTTIVNKWEENKTDVKNEINAKYEGAKTDITNNVIGQIGDIIVEGNNETINNITNNVTNDVSNQLKLEAKDLALSVKKEIVEGDNSTVNNISGKLGDKAKDFQDQIDAANANVADQVSRGEAETARLEDVKADKADLDALESKGNNAFGALGDRVTTVEGDIANINGKIDYVENNKGLAIDNAKTYVDNSINTAIDNKFGDYTQALRVTVGNAVLNIKKGIQEGSNETFNIVKGKVSAAGKDFQDQIDSLNVETVRLEDVKADKADLADLEAKGNDAATNMNGKITAMGDRVTTVEGDVANINGKIDYVENNKDVAINAGKTYVDDTVNNAIDLAYDNAKTTINNKWEENKGDVNAAVNGKIENITNDVTNNVTNEVMNQIGDIVIDGSSETVVNIKNEITNDVSNQLKLDAKNLALSIKKDIVEGNNSTVNNITGKVNAEVDNAKTVLGETAKDFQDQIDETNSKVNTIAKAGQEAIVVTNENVNNQVIRGEAAYDDLLSRLENASTQQDIDDALNEYKKNAYARIKATVVNNGPAAKDALTQAKDDAKKDATDYVKDQIDQAIADNTQAGKDYVKEEIDNAIAGLIPAGEDLTGRIENIENTINKGKVVVNNVKNQGVNAGKTIVAKAPAIKAVADSKAAKATTYVKNVNAKADTALALGHDNTQAINQERVDRIQGQRDTLSAANSYTDSRFNSMQQQVDDNRKRAAAGISGVAAMTNIPQLSGNANYSFGVGIGGFDSEQSIAAGMTGRVGSNVVIRSSVSTSTQGEMVWGAGLGYEW